jgi:hypothetical protein
MNYTQLSPDSKRVPRIMINATITDKTALASVSETSVLTYLKVHGWTNYD